MALKQQQDLLARLYTDAELRERFRAEPAEVSAEFGLSGVESGDLSAIAEAEVDWFADSLFWKRLREVKKLLPVSSRIIGAEFDPQFREFSAGFNPQSVKKHLEDALEFSAWFLRRQGISGDTADVLRFESTRLRHNARERVFSACGLSHDVRPHFVGNQAAQDVTLRPKRGIAVWVSVGGRTRFFYL